VRITERSTLVAISYDHVDDCYRGGPHGIGPGFDSTAENADTETLREH
jgi:hypothetical protein